jgi:hypothetical protein
LINLALLRDANLRLPGCEGSEEWLAARQEHRAAHPTSAGALRPKKL